MKCKSCGQIIDDGAICPNCGIKNDNNLIKEEFNKKHNKKKKHFIIPICITVFVLLIVLFCLYLFLINKKTSKEIFILGFKDTTSRVFLHNDIKKQSFSGDLKMNFNTDELNQTSFIDFLNQLNVQVNSKIDTISNISDIDLIINYNQIDPLGIGIYTRDNNIYLKLLGLYNKYIKIPISNEQYNLLYEINKNGKILKKSIDNAFISALDDKYISNSIKKIKIDGKNIKVTAHNLSLDNTNYKEFVKNFIKELSSDKEFINLISKISQVEASNINEIINDINYDEISIDGSLNCTILTSGIIPKYKGIELNMSNDLEKFSLSYYKINDEKSELNVKYNDNNWKYLINSKGINVNKKTTINADLGSYKMNIELKTSLSKITKFEDIDINNSIMLEEFIKNGYKDINTKAMEIIYSTVENITTNNLEYEIIN